MVEVDLAVAVQVEAVEDAVTIGVDRGVEDAVLVEVVDLGGVDDAEGQREAGARSGGGGLGERVTGEPAGGIGAIDGELDHGTAADIIDRDRGPVGKGDHLARHI